LENGANSPGLEIIGRLATVLGCEPAELLKLALENGSGQNVTVYCKPP
jgi:transcriptional regulator with XRE-family HTH domain